MSRKSDLTGQVFGNLAVIQETDQRLGGEVVWKCLCGCGETSLVRGYCLRSGMTKSCGCLRKKSANDLTGQRFGKLTVITDSTRRYRGSIVWECLCDCGNTTHVSSCSLKRLDGARSCGCLQREVCARSGRLRKKDLTGQTFNLLTALYDSGERKNEEVVWACRCVCGVECLVTAYALHTGSTKSCGCLKVLASKRNVVKMHDANRTHGLSRSSQYRSSHCAKRRATKLQRTPPWSDYSVIQEFYKECPEGYTVDHVLPLQGTLICGLHVVNNLQYLTSKENSKKGNRFTPYVESLN